MAKIAFTKLGLKKDEGVETFDWNGQTIEVKNYLPIEDKLEMIANIMNKSIDDNGYYNSAKIYVNMILEIIYTYTNITFTDKQKEDVYKTYDLLASSGLSGEIIGTHMSPAEYNQIKTWVIELIHNVYDYKNSVYAILDNIKDDYANLSLDSKEIEQVLTNSDNLSLLKDVLTKLG